jgi:NTE family protein
MMTTQSLHRSFFIGGSYHFITQKSKFQTVIPPGVKNGSFNFAQAEIVFFANTLNDRNYPTEGRDLNIAGQLYFANNYRINYEKGTDTVYFPLQIENTIFNIPVTEDVFNDLIIDPLTPDVYGVLHGNYRKFVKIGNSLQFVPLVSFGLTLSAADNAIFYTLKLGGFQQVKISDKPFIGLNYGEQDYENFLNTGLLFQNIILKSLYLKYGANFLLPYEHVPINDLGQFNSSTLFNENSMLGYGAEITYKSFLGPVSLGISRNTRDSYFRFYFAVGFSFNHMD